MRFGKILPHIFLAVLVMIFVLLNNLYLKQNKNISPIKNNKIVANEEAAKVLRVIDGDTIEVNLNGKRETVRLIGIDSPEVLTKEKSNQCFGQEAFDKAKEILNNKDIVLEPDSTQGERDSYNRLLRYVFVDGLSFNEFMISEGYAKEYTFKNNVYKYQSEFKDAERKARLNRRGLWEDGACD
jgi:micrococcal nuclease